MKTAILINPIGACLKGLEVEVLREEVMTFHHVPKKVYITRFPGTDQESWHFPESLAMMAENEG